MKTFLPVVALAVSTCSLWANAGSGPWANGAYYPGQLDGRYSANVYNNTQDRFDTDQMDTPSGNRLRTDTFSTNAGTADTTTIESSLVTNVTSSVTVSNNAGVITSSNTVITTDITTQLVTNTVPGIDGSTNLVTSGSAAVVSGVLGFGVRNGTPAVQSSQGGASGGGAAQQGGGESLTVQSIELDTSHNYFVIYVDGEVFAGQTAAGINLDTQRVAGSLWSGVGRPTFLVVTNSETTTDTNTSPPVTTTNDQVEVIALPSATAGGYFNAKIKSDKSPFVFKGAGEISTRGTPQGNEGNATYPFDLDGIKSSDNSISGYSLTGRNAP